MKMKLNLEIEKDKIIYQGKVKSGKKGIGVIRLNEKTDKYTYIIFPLKCKDENGKLNIVIDEILNKEAIFKDEKYQIELQREYKGKTCIVITSDKALEIKLRKRNILYETEVKKTFNGQGMIRINEGFLGDRSYVIFPISQRDEWENISVEIDEILNKGIRPDTDHTSCIRLSKTKVGKKCIICLQESDIN